MEKLKKLDLQCKALHLKEYNARLLNGKLSVVYDGIVFNKLTNLKAYIRLKKQIERLKSL